MHFSSWLHVLMLWLSGWMVAFAQAPKSVDPCAGHNHSQAHAISLQETPTQLIALQINLSGLNAVEQQERLLAWLQNESPFAPDVERSWRPAEMNTSPGGFHVVFDQLHQGIPIPYHSVKFTLTKQGYVKWMAVRLYVRPNEINSTGTHLINKPKLPAELLESQALETFGGFIHESEPAWMIESNGQLRAAHRISTLEDKLGGSHEIWYDPFTGDQLSATPRWCNHTAESGTGRGRVFRPDPLTTGRMFYTRGTMQSDNNNSNNRFFDQQYVEVELQDLEIGPNGYTLTGPFVKIEDISAPTYPTATSSDGVFLFNRSQVGFEQVSAYYHIDSFQRYIQSLNFNNLGHRPLRIDAHGFRDDNSAFFPGGAQSYILMGEGGVDDAEDADVLIHEYLHALSEHASPRTRNGTERRGLDEGFGDYFAASWSRASTDFRWDDLFTWDGHNEFWEGRTASYDRFTYPEMKTLSAREDYIYLIGQLWATAMMKVWAAAGRTVADRIVLQTLYLTQNNMTLVQSAHASIQADSLLYNGQHTQVLQRAFCEAGILEGQVCEALSISPRSQRPEFQLYPNPATEAIYVSHDAHAGLFPHEIRIVDLTGKVRYETFLYGNRMRIDTSALQAGVYVVEIHQNGIRLWNEKLIVHN